MKSDSCVGNLIKTKYLDGICKVVAGKGGLNKQVSWVHILEIKDVLKECVDGNEMVLTTGICFTDKETAVNFFKELIDQNISALCIETALYYHKIDKELKQLADEHNIPLIEITAISRFKDIAKGLNKMLLRGEVSPYIDADIYDRKMNELESKGTLEDGIRYTAEYLNLEIAYLPSIGRHYTTSETIQKESQLLVNQVAKKSLSDELYCRGKIAIKYINIGYKNYGAILFKRSESDITEFDQIILGRLANRIRKDLLDEIKMTEEALYKQNGWVSDWLEGSLSEEEITTNLISNNFYETYKEYCVCTIKINRKILFSDFITDMTIFIRRIFEQKNLEVIGFLNDNKAHYIVMNKDSSAGLIEKMRLVIEDIKSINKTLINYKEIAFSLGKVVNESTMLCRSFDSSFEFLENEKLKKHDLIVFDELYVDKILFHIIDTPYMKAFINEYLGELLKPQNEELLQTLIVYYECNCSKQKTAERLFIVRQTLYFRLQKLEDILGKNFVEGEYKAALELACKAYVHKLKY